MFFGQGIRGKKKCLFFGGSQLEDGQMEKDNIFHFSRLKIPNFFSLNVDFLVFYSRVNRRVHVFTSYDFESNSCD